MNGPSQHLDDAIWDIVRLSRTDPERIAAYEHATNCEPCRVQLREAEELHALLDRVDIPLLSVLALEQAKKAVLARVAKEATSVANLSLVCGVVVFSLILFTARHVLRDPQLWLQGLGLFFAAMMLFAFAKNHLQWVGISNLALSMVFVAMTAHPAGPSVNHAFSCMMTELLAAVFPMVVMIGFVVRRHQNLPQSSFIAAATLGAVVGQAGLHVTCPLSLMHAHAWHSHVMGVAIATMIGSIGASTTKYWLKLTVKSPPISF